MHSRTGSGQKSVKSVLGEERSVYVRKDLWERCVVSLEWKSNGIMDGESGEEETGWLDSLCLIVTVELYKVSLEVAPTTSQPDMNSKCWLMLQTNVCNGQEVCQFLSLFGVCTLLESKFFLLNVNISMTVGRIFTKIYIFISLSWTFFENRKNSGLTPGQNDDPVTRTWKMTQMTHWPGDPNDPVPCLIATFLSTVITLKL